MTCPHCNSMLADDARFCGACGKATVPTGTSTAVPNAAAAAQPAADPFGGDAYAAMIGREIAGRYRVTKKLGEGGMGAVFRAEQISLKRACAVKLLRPGLADNAQLVRRFNAEAEAVAKLSHPNTVNIYDFGQDADGALFIAMEFVDGTSLRETIQHEAPLAFDRALAIAMQIAASLADAHAHNIVHRDLKPDNVMLSTRGKQRDVVHVLDFGIAKLRDDSRKTGAMTQAGDMLGTPQYMAPEQIRGEAIDGRADVYALGCIVYEMLTARMPFEAESILAMLSKHLTETVQPPSQRRPELAIPPALDQLVVGALAKDPAQRPATMELFGEQLAAVYQTLPRALSTATPTGNLPLPAAPPSVVMGVAATAAAGPPPGMPLATPTPTPPAAPHVVTPNPAFNFVPPTTLPPAHVKPQPADGGNKSMWIMMGVIALILAAAGAYFALNRKDSIFDDDGARKLGEEIGKSLATPPRHPNETPEQREAREKLEQQIKDEIDKALKDPDQ